MARHEDMNDLRAAQFVDVDMSDSVFREVNLSGARLRGVLLNGADIDGDITGLRLNGVDVAPLVEAELDRLHPERTRLRPTTAAGLREALATIEQIWAPTLRRALERPPEEVHRSVDGEWSLVDTLRHLVFVTDAWFRNAVKGEPEPFHPIGLPAAFLAVDELAVTTPPALDAVLRVRAQRLAELHDFARTASDEDLHREHESGADQPCPPPAARSALTCLGVILNEEWTHHQFACRDLAIIDQGADQPPPKQ